MIKASWGWVVVSGALVTPAVACDLCAVYPAARARPEWAEGWFAGVAEQYTHLATLQLDGQEVPNPAGQFLDSSVAQVFVGANFTDRIGLQFNLPVIYRSFRRTTGAGTDQGTEFGLGDAALLANVIIWRREKQATTFLWDLQAGVKLPTGNTRRLEEELSPPPAPPTPESAVHGHDLTLGSGSVDGLFGTGLFARRHRMCLTAQVQYALGSEGDFAYRFADDLTWSGGPGYYLQISSNKPPRLVFK